MAGMLPRRVMMVRRPMPPQQLLRRATSSSSSSSSSSFSTADADADPPPAPTLAFGRQVAPANVMLDCANLGMGSSAEPVSSAGAKRRPGPRQMQSVSQQFACNELVQRALDAGVAGFETAPLHGMGASEELLGTAISAAITAAAVADLEAPPRPYAAGPVLATRVGWLLREPDGVTPIGRGTWMLEPCSLDRGKGRPPKSGLQVNHALLLCFRLFTKPSAAQRPPAPLRRNANTLARRASGEAVHEVVAPRLS
jgi:hypothetical protein